MAIGIGVELSPAALRGVVVERSGSSIALRAASTVPCETAQPETLTQGLTRLRAVLRPSQPIILGLPSTSAVLTTVAPLIVSAPRAGLAVQFELQQQLPFTLDDAAWHYRWLAANGHAKAAGPQKDRVAHPGALLDRAVVVAMRRALLEERLACCRRAGFEVGAVGMTSVAALNAWSSQHRGAPLPPGATLLRVVNEQAVEWIFWTPRGLEVIPVAAASAETFWAEVVAACEALRAQGLEMSAPVWVMGTGLVPPALEQEMSSRLGLSMRRFDPASVIASGLERCEQPDQCVAAVGLAFQGLGLAPVPLNLLAYRQHAARAQQIRRVAMIVSGCCALASLAFGISGMLEVRHRRRVVLGSLQRQERLYQTLRPEVRAMLQRQERILQRSLQLEQLVLDAPALTQLLAHITQVLPEGMWLTKFEAARSGSSPSATAPSGTIDALLEGRARSFQDVNQALNQLKTIPGMGAVKLLTNAVTTDPASGKEVIVFSLQLQSTQRP